MPKPNLTNERLAQIAAGAKEATPGEWTFDDSQMGSAGGPYFGLLHERSGWAGKPHQALIPTDAQDDPVARANARHIANCDPPTVLAMVGEIQKLREALQEIVRRSDTFSGSDFAGWGEGLEEAAEIARTALKQEPEHE